jgi:RimJ/RimL family protein N-acetyltransferase/SAM-dependent methyltransferase
MSEPRVRLRAIREGDLPDYVRWLNDPEVTQFTQIESGDITLEGEREWFARITAPEEGNRHWAIELEGRHVGNCALMPDPAGLTAGFGIIIGDKSAWNRGCGTAAVREVLRIGFAEMGLQRVHLTAMAENARAIRCYEKCGFRREGLRRRHYLKRGRLVDVVCMGMLREEWEEGIAQGTGLPQVAAEAPLYSDAWSAEAYDRGLDAWRDDVEVWLALAKETGGPVLELACGTGRALLPLAEAGYECVGVDLSPHMLAVAQRKREGMAAEVRARVTLTEGDMRGFELRRQFGLVFMTARTLQALLTREDQRACLERCARHLRPGGLLGIDVFNPRLDRLVRPGGVDEKPDEHEGPEGRQVRETGHTDYDLASQTLIWRSRLECRERDGQTTVRGYVCPLHYFFRFEMEWMLEACGFEVEAWYGDFARSTFTAESPEMVFVARRR